MLAWLAESNIRSQKVKTVKNSQKLIPEADSANAVNDVAVQTKAEVAVTLEGTTEIQLLFQDLDDL